jgi:hypothetical protein
VVIKRAFQALGATVPNVGPWARRLATALDDTPEITHGSWAKRSVTTLEDELGQGSWVTRLRRAIALGLIEAGGTDPEPDPPNEPEIIFDPGTDYDAEEPATWDPPGQPQVAPPAAPPATSPPTKTTLPNGKVRKNVKWVAVTDAAAYDVSIDNGPPIDVGNATEIDVDVAPGQSGNARVRARNSQGTSEFSPPVDISEPEVGEGPVVTGALGDLEDVDTTGQADGDELTFDGALWKPVGEPEVDTGQGALLTESGDTLTTESGDALVLDVAVLYADVLTSLGAARYWDLSEPSGNFQPVIGTDQFTVGSGLARAQDGPFGGDHTMAITGGIHTIPKAELGTTEHTWSVWVYGGGGTDYRSIVGGGGTYRFYYLFGRQMYPYMFSWGTVVGPALSEARWYLVTIGSGPDGMTYWLDGAVAYTGGAPTATTTHATVARWGTNENGSEAFVNRMAHPATWNRKLSNAEVAQLWAHGS